jgi:hypothetical protein
VQILDARLLREAEQGALACKHARRRSLAQALVQWRTSAQEALEVRQKAKREEELWDKIHGWLSEDYHARIQPEAVSSTGCQIDQQAPVQRPWTLGSLSSSPEHPKSGAGRLAYDRHKPDSCQEQEDPSLTRRCKPAMDIGLRQEPLDPPTRTGMTSSATCGNRMGPKLSETLAAELEAALQNAAPKLNIDRLILGIAEGPFPELLPRKGFSDDTARCQQSGNLSGAPCKGHVIETADVISGSADMPRHLMRGGVEVPCQRSTHPSDGLPEPCMHLDLEYRAESVQNQDPMPRSLQGSSGTFKHPHNASKPPLRPGAQHTPAKLQAHHRCRNQQKPHAIDTQHQPNHEDAAVRMLALSSSSAGRVYGSQTPEQEDKGELLERLSPRQRSGGTQECNYAQNGVQRM